MDYSEIISEAWQIIWKHKILWLFGILAGCATQSGSSGGQINRHVNRGHLPPQAEHFLRTLPDWQITAIVIAIVLLIFFLAMLALALGSIGHIGLIKGTLLARDKRRDEKLTFSEVWQASTPFFWRMLGLNLLIGLGVLIVFGAVAAVAGLITFATLGIGLLCIMPLLCLAAPVAWGVGIFVEQANTALVVEDLNIINAIHRGWEVFYDNLGEMLVMGVLLTLGGGIVALVIAAPLGFALASLMGVVLVGGEHAAGAGLLLAGLCLVSYLPVFILLNGILQALVHSAWTLTYVDLSGYIASPPVVEELPPAY